MNICENNIKIQKNLDKDDEAGQWLIAYHILSRVLKTTWIYGYCKVFFFNSLEVNYRDIYLFFDDDKATLQIGVFFLALPNKDF